MSRRKKKLPEKKEDLLRLVALFMGQGGRIRGRAWRNQWITDQVRCPDDAVVCEGCPFREFEKYDDPCHAIFDRLSPKDLLCLVEMGYEVEWPEECGPWGEP